VLLSAGLLVGDADWLMLTPALSVVVALDDAPALELLIRALNEASLAENALHRTLLGERGEEFVVDCCRSELESLGRSDLSNRVRRVSLVSDSLGYDVLAPSIGSSDRHLEVKTSTRRAVGSFEFFISRNEFEASRREPTTWALVACRAGQDGIALVGWCRGAALFAYLPDDQNGHWTEARVRLPDSVLAEGFPSAI
jgi:hypothetical protein